MAPDGTARLLAGRCGRCGELHFPVAASCPHCSADDVTEVALSEVGALWAWTAVNAPPPGYRGGVPFGFGVVELPEGIRVVTRLTEADPARLQRDQTMRLEIVPLHADDDGRPVVTYAFAPAAETAGGRHGGPRRSASLNSPAEGGDGAPPGAAKPPAEQP